jgi:cysteinyl-tRNA synthetase
MPLRLHNTLTGRVEPFAPLRDGVVTFYSCGPTVYDYAHIGNFRSFLAADLLRRWLESPLCERVDTKGKPTGQGGYAVRHVMNITDVGHMVDDSAADGGGEDKMEAARKRLLEDKKSGKLPADALATFDPADPYSIAEFYARAFIEDATLMGLKVAIEATEEGHPELMPRPTRFVKPMLEMVLNLIERGHAYVASDGVAYFDTQSFPAYGRLSGNTLEKIRSGAGGRVSQSTQSVKKHPADFMLWKPDPTHLMRWDPSKLLGRQVALKEGYPGWHLECSAMAQELLGEVIDLHSGGEDNIFPHHECEIAQSCCAHGTPQFARFWFHPRFLQVEGAKMSKSKGNFFTISDLVSKGFEPAAIRLELIKTHYRSNANFTEQGLKDSARTVERWRRVVEQGEASGSAGARDEAVERAFADAMNDDLNIAGAIGVINSWLNGVKAPGAAEAAMMRGFDEAIGVLSLKRSAAAGPAEGDAHIDDLVRRRTEARATKNWAEADKIRDELNRLQIVVEDTAQGPKWSRRAGL